MLSNLPINNSKYSEKNKENKTHIAIVKNPIKKIAPIFLSKPFARDKMYNINEIIKAMDPVLFADNKIATMTTKNKIVLLFPFSKKINGIIIKQK